MQNLPISAFFCFIVLYSALFCFIVVSFFISVAYLRQFSTALFPFSVFPCLVPFFLFLLLQANSICRSSLFLASGSNPDKNTSNSPFLPENLIILTFPSPKICIYQKKCVSLHRKVRIGVPENFNFWGERRHRLPVYLAERYKPLHTDCRTRLHQISGFLSSTNPLTLSPLPRALPETGYRVDRDRKGGILDHAGGILDHANYNTTIITTYTTIYSQCQSI